MCLCVPAKIFLYSIYSILNEECYLNGKLLFIGGFVFGPKAHTRILSPPSRRLPAMAPPTHIYMEYEALREYQERIAELEIQEETAQGAIKILALVSEKNRLAAARLAKKYELLQQEHEKFTQHTTASEETLLQLIVTMNASTASGFQDEAKVDAPWAAASVFE